MRSALELKRSEWTRAILIDGAKVDFIIINRINQIMEETKTSWHDTPLLKELKKRIQLNTPEIVVKPRQGSY